MTLKTNWLPNDSGLSGAVNAAATLVNDHETQLTTRLSPDELSATIGEAIAASGFARTDRGERAVNCLDMNLGDRVHALAGDSTGNFWNEWPELAYDALGPRWAAYDIEMDYWANDPGTGYTSTRVIQEGDAGAEESIVFRDTFTRTASELIGSAPDVGAAWGSDWSNANGDWTINGSAAIATTNTPRGAVIANGAPGDAVYTVVGTASSVPIGGVAHSYGWAVAYSSYNNCIRIVLNTSPAGTTSLSVYKRIGGVQTQIGATVSNPLTASTGGQAFTLTVTLVGTALTVQFNGHTVSGTLASGDLTMLGGNLAITPARDGETMTEVSIEATQPIEVGTLTILNASRSGSTLAYQLANLNAMFPPATKIDVLHVNSCHNYALKTPEQWAAEVDEFLAAYRAIHPESGIIIHSQNPQRSPGGSAAGRAAHLERLAAIRSYAEARGYGYVPVIENWVQSPDSAGMIYTDGIHPTTEDNKTTAVSGSAFWADLVTGYIKGLSLFPTT